jgi:hypothetical protein
MLDDVARRTVVSREDYSPKIVYILTS